MVTTTNDTNNSLRVVLWTSLSVMVFVLCLLLLGTLFNGKTGFEKTLTRLIFPIGLTWLGLTAWTCHFFFQYRFQKALGASIIWILFTLAGSLPIVDFWLRQLETQEIIFQPGIDEDLDLLVVLGGGTRQGPMRAQAGSSGDRIVFAAELYHQGFVRSLITTGEATSGFGGERSSSHAQTTEIWQRLGIPADAIAQLNGVNTYQEIQNLKQLQAELTGKRVGLLTSAYHLPRAMRLARAAGLTTLIPVAADFQSTSESFSFVDLLPSAQAFEQFARCQHEFIASFVNR